MCQKTDEEAEASSSVQAKILHEWPMVSAGREVTYPKVREACTREHTKDQTIQCKEVRMRLFYNSQVSKRNVESLLARGNKRRSLQHGKKVHGNRFETSTTDLKCVKNINSKTAHKVRSHVDIVVSPVVQKYVQNRDGKVRGLKILLHRYKTIKNVVV